MADMESELPDLRDRLVRAGRLADVEMRALAAWRWERQREEPSSLTGSGRSELWGLGQRWGRRLASGAAGNSTVVRSSRKQRCQDSARAFLEGLFNATMDGEGELPEVLTDDHLLRFYDDCPKYQNTAKNRYKPEVEKFESSATFMNMVARVGTRTGVPVQSEEVEVMWNICR
jgi:hypothetical protein